MYCLIPISTLMLTFDDELETQVDTYYGHKDQIAATTQIMAKLRC